MRTRISTSPPTTLKTCLLLVPSRLHRDPSRIHPPRITNYRLAKTTAPPNSAPIATAPVCTAPAFGLVAVSRVLVAAAVTELLAEAALLVKEANAEVRESRSEPVAVASSDEKEERRLAESALMELSWDETAEVMDETTELERVDSEEREDEEDEEMLEAEEPVMVEVTTTV